MQEEMTVSQLRHKLAKLEISIFDLIQEFQSGTNIEVGSVSLRKIDTPVLKQDTKLVAVDIDLNIG